MCFGILYAGFAVLMILLVALSVPIPTADAIFYTFLIQIAHDTLINQPLKILCHLALLKMLKKKKWTNCRRLIIFILDVNVVTAFI